jgi:hypothetical protein
MRPCPVKPKSSAIWEYKEEHDCGIYTARQVLTDEYDADLKAWLVEAVELLLSKRAVGCGTS